MNAMPQLNLSTTQQYFNKTRSITNLTEWNKQYQIQCLRREESEIDFDAEFHKTIPSSQPTTHAHALFYRRLALSKWPESKKTDSSIKITGQYSEVTPLLLDKHLSRLWQSYWLNCCRSDKCNYVFNVLIDCGIDREIDIAVTVSDPSFHEELSAREKRGYIDLCINYLLRRYSLCRAFKLWNRFKPAFRAGTLVDLFYDMLRFSLPRLWGAIMVGILFLMGGIESIELPTRLHDVSAAMMALLIALTLFIAFIYLSYECGKLTEYGRTEALIRSTNVALLGLVESAAISAFFVHRILIPVHRHTTSAASNPITVDFWITWGAFTVAAFLIGIFLQSFWEEKTIAEPL